MCKEGWLASEVPHWEVTACSNSIFWKRVHEVLVNLEAPLSHRTLSFLWWCKYKVDAYKRNVNTFWFMKCLFLVSFLQIQQRELNTTCLLNKSIKWSSWLFTSIVRDIKLSMIHVCHHKFTMGFSHLNVKSRDRRNSVWITFTAEQLPEEPYVLICEMEIIFLRILCGMEVKWWL